MGLILLLDMDYFFAACEELRNPELKTKAFVVGTAEASKKERGVVQTSNYVARSFKIKSAMPVSTALKLKPDLMYLPSDEKFYSEMSEKVIKLLQSYNFKMEVMSIDEMAIDTNNMDYDSAMRLAENMKAKINGEIGLPCTIGISTTKIYAKMVCDAFKPNRIGLVKKEELTAFLSDKDVDAISGVGGKTKEKLNGMKIFKILDLLKCSPMALVENFGRFGPELLAIAKGEDDSGVQESTDAISIGREITMEQETDDIKSIQKVMEPLTREAIDELNKKKMWYRSVSAKVRYPDFSFRTKTKRLANNTDSYDIALSTAMGLLNALLEGRKARKVGVRLSELSAKGGQRTFF